MRQLKSFDGNKISRISRSLIDAPSTNHFTSLRIINKKKQIFSPPRTTTRVTRLEEEEAINQFLLPFCDLL